MLIIDIIRVALKSLAGNRLRSFLSMLGIIIGVAAVIAVVAISSGAEQQILDSLNNLGTNMITISHGMTRGTGGRISQSTTDLFTYEMADQIKALCPDLNNIAPYVDGSGLLVYNDTNVQGRVRATTPEFFEMVDLDLAQGRMFSEADLEESRLVVILGSEVATDLFGETNPIGQEIKITRGNYKFSLNVIGVFESKGQVMFTNYDSQVFLPVTTWMNRLQSIKYVNGFSAQARSNEVAEIAVAQVEYFFYQRYKDLDKVNVTSQTEMLSMASDFANTFKILLGGIASIALLVGGIGIMNITLVSVTERTREIGIRKALGAKRRVILFQFLIESCTVSLFGGLLGLGFGTVVAMLVSHLGGWPFQVTAFSVAIAMGFSMMIGLFFGIYPASRAARLDPVDALSYE